MRPAFLAVSATALLALGTALCVQAVLPGPATPPAVAKAVAAAPALSGDAEQSSVKPAPVPVSEPTTAAVVRVKTVRIDPELPAPTISEAEQSTSSAAEMKPGETATGEGTAASPARVRAAAPTNASADVAADEDASSPRLRTARTKPQVAKRTSHHRRRQQQLAGDDVAKEPLSYAPKEAGPESLNPLGKLLGGTR